MKINWIRTNVALLIWILSIFVLSNIIKAATPSRIGDEANKITIVFSDVGYDLAGNAILGWSDYEKYRMNSFVNKMYPLIRELYGSPATSFTVTVVKNLGSNNIASFHSPTDEIRMNKFHPQVFTHELIHAFRNDNLITSNNDWKYDVTLSGFEEGFAQAVSYECMNSYINLYPDDDIVDTGLLWKSEHAWDYDFQNTPILRGTNFWSSSDGTGLARLRYEVAAAAISKINIEVPGFYENFNQKYYQKINNDPAWRPTRDSIVDIIESLVSRIEGIKTPEWIDWQNVFYCQDIYGKKIFNKLQNYPDKDFWNFQSIFYIETMPCKSEWSCWDEKKGKYIYHNLNGSRGNARLFNWNDEKIWEGPLMIKRTENPPDFLEFGSDKKNLTTASIQWPKRGDNDFIFGLNKFGLYIFETTFGGTTSYAYRLIGNKLKNYFGGISGGIIGRRHREGIIYLNHEKYPQEDPLVVYNNAFHGERKWANKFNSRKGYYNSVPGKVYITFFDTKTGNMYYTQRNIGYGSKNGSQMFLLNFEQEAAIISVPLIIIDSVQSGSDTCTISTTIIDNGTVEKVVLYYRFPGIYDDYVHQANMSNTSANTWKATVSDVFALAHRVEYYISAWDNDGNMSKTEKKKFFKHLTHPHIEYVT